MDESKPSEQYSHFEISKREGKQSQEPLGSFRLIDTAGGINLVPVPSRDPNDPLRLPKWRKWACLVTLCLYAGVGLSAVQSISGILPTMISYYMGLDGSQGSSESLSHIARAAEGMSGVPNIPGAPSYQTISQLGTLPSLFVGIGGVLSVLLSQATGTRFVMIIDSTILLVTLIWCATSHGAARGLYSHIAARCVMGLGVGSVESLVPLILRDLHYVHERNSRLAAMWASGGICGAGIGIASTYIVSALSWRWFYWILAAAAGLCLLMVIAFVPETSWPRTTEDYRGTSVIGHDGYTTPVKPSNRPYSYLYSLRPLSVQGGASQVARAFMDMVCSLCFPNVLWVIFLNAVFIGISLSTGIEFGVVLVSPPYNWKDSNVGLMGIPLAIAGVLSVLISGIGADMMIKLMAKRANGRHEPEHQLINMILPIISGFIGSLVFGIACNNPYKYNWMVQMVCFGLQQFGFVSANVIGTTYTVECFPDLASALVIIVGAFRNIVGFGISYGVVSFVDRAGFAGCFGIYSGLLGAFGVLGIPLYVWGRPLRMRTEKSSIRRLHDVSR